jgi:hypothetical protein
VDEAFFKAVEVAAFVEDAALVAAVFVADAALVDEAFFEAVDATAFIEEAALVAAVFDADVALVFH